MTSDETTVMSLLPDVLKTRGFICCSSLNRLFTDVYLIFFRPHESFRTTFVYFRCFIWDDPEFFKIVPLTRILRALWMFVKFFPAPCQRWQSSTGQTSQIRWNLISCSDLRPPPLGQTHEACFHRTGRIVHERKERLNFSDSYLNLFHFIIIIIIRFVFDRESDSRQQIETRTDV